MHNTLDTLTQQASQALTDRDYPQCETLCLRGLAQAREAGNWVDYARIVLPLQEARRLMRQAALEGGIRLGTGDLELGQLKELNNRDACCIVITAPHTTDDAAAFAIAASKSGKAIEVLYAQPETGSKFWTVHTFCGPLSQAIRAAPQDDWQDRWLPGQGENLQETSATPAHWFMQANEALGNAALIAIMAVPGTVERVVEIEAAISAVGDHEHLHKALADAARAIQHCEAR